MKVMKSQYFERILEGVCSVIFFEQSHANVCKHGTFDKISFPVDIFVIRVP